MEENNDNQNQAPQVVIPEGLANLADNLKGVPGADSILGKIGDEAKAAGIIKTVDPNKPNESSASDADLNPIEALTRSATELEEAPTGNAAAGQEPTGQEPTEDDIVDPLLGSITSTKKSKKAESIADFDQLKEYTKKTFGQEVGDFDTLQKFMENSAKWRSAATKASDLESQVSQYEEVFNNAPESLISGLKAYFDGRKDWASEITNMSTLDYKQNVENMNAADLVNHYFPGEFDPEDFTAEDKPQALTIAERAAKEKFISEKKSLEEKSAMQMEAATKRFNARKESMASSFSSLKESFPNLESSVEKSITKAMESGDINSLFLNNDGSYKPDAAEKLLMAMHGKKTIDNLMKVAARKAESKTNEDILTRGADTPAPPKGGPSNDVMGIKLKNELQDILGGLGKKQTY